MKHINQIATKSFIALISLLTFTYTTTIGSVSADEIKHPSAKFNQPEEKDKFQITTSVFDEEVKEDKTLEIKLFNKENKNITEKQKLVDVKSQLISDLTGKLYLQLKLNGKFDKEQLVFQNDKNEDLPHVTKVENDHTLVRVLIEQHMNKINMHVKTSTENVEQENKETVYSVHFKEELDKHDDGQEVPSKHQNKSNDQLNHNKNNADDKKDDQKLDNQEKRTSFITEKSLNEASAEKDKVQQDSNKKVENVQPKASGTLKVENNPATVKKDENNHKSQSKQKDDKSKKEKKKVTEKEKALPAFDRNDDKNDSNQLTSDIKELDKPNHKKQYMLFGAGIVLATILLISAHFYSRKRGNQV
ncbi:heme ABC transporter permease [Staphylococcus sp. 30400_3112M30941]|nr:heme ABC transporter permease [Staphylococcus sp. 30403_3112M30944]MBO0945899.1 heme ABC transporter permease [Staphylococcus sp. 30402_3112M30943]MBO0963351.1 heme ABC transporter permease [Staphylococcus sp. 30400_3112M30941]MBO0966517.1 heme ABC transporter permease [Staphylococcus sp. 30401_3112M30942]